MPAGSSVAVMATGGAYRKEASPILEIILQFVLFGLLGWLAILFEVIDAIKGRNNTHSDDAGKTK